LWVREKDGNGECQSRSCSVKLQGKELRSMSGAGIREHGVIKQRHRPTKVG